MSDASKATDAASPISQPQQASSVLSPEPSGATNPAIAQAPFKLWNPPTEARPAVAPILDDLEPTAAEVVAAYQAQARRAENLRNAPLLTQEMRDRQEQEKYKKWPNCTIRIRFHNQMQLEKAFPSTNKIKSVYAFVRECLNEETKAIKFVLYQPPARELKVSDTSVRDKTLMELQLAPSSVLLLRFLLDELNDREKVPPLDQSVLATAMDFPTVTPSADGVTVASAAPMAKQSNKAVENKLAKLFKLQPRK